MQLDATPAVDAAVLRALLVALGEAGMGLPRASPYDHAWREAALREAVDGDEPELGYALSPRSTLGATRA